MTDLNVQSKKEIQNLPTKTFRIIEHWEPFADVLSETLIWERSQIS